jgi:glycosyltransferase involved in cell wall biosynthesis
MCLKRIVITWVTTQEGGAEESVRILSSTIYELYKVEVHLIIWNLNDSTHKNISSNSNPKVNYISCDTHSQYVECLRKSLKGSPQEIFLFGNHRSFSIDVFEAKCKKIKCAIVFRGIVIPNKPIRIISNKSLDEFVTDKIDWKLLSEADAVVGISDCSSDSLKKFISSEKIYRIYNGVDDSWFIENSSININKVPNRFLICSRLVPWKNISIGLKGFFKLANKYPEISLDVIGEGIEMDSLSKLAEAANMKDKVHFRGWQSDPREWYRKSDCLIHPSPIEGFGRVIAEANANGLIAVVPQSGGAGELVIDHHTGFTFLENDVSSCCDALQSFLNSSFEQRLSMTKKAILRSKTLFSSTHMATEYVGFANYHLKK